MILHASVHACVCGSKCVGEHDGWALEDNLFTVSVSPLYACVRINVEFKMFCLE